MPPIQLNPQTITPKSIAHFFLFMFTILFTLLVLLAIVLAKYERYHLSQAGRRPWVIRSHASRASHASYGTFAGPWDEDVDAEDSDMVVKEDAEDNIEECPDEVLSVIEDIVVDEECSIGEEAVMGEHDFEELGHADGTVGAL